MSTVKSKKQTPDGVRLFKTPPEGFDLRKASDRELAIYGMPRRPDPRTHARLAARWESIATRPLRFVAPEFGIDPPFVRTAPALRASSISGSLAFGLSSHAWSGALVNRQNSEPLDVVTGTWTVPAVSPPLSAWNGNAWTDGGPYTCGTWVGLDGWTVTELLQAGTASSVTVLNGQPHTKYYAWTEWFGAPPKTLSNFAVSAGDQISCGVCAPFEDTHGVASFLNHTTGLAMTFGIEPPSGKTLRGNNAEWIVEDPAQVTSTGQQPAPFPFYGFDVFTGCSAGSHDYELNLSSATTINLVNSDNELLSWAAILSPTTLLCQCEP